MGDFNGNFEAAKDLFTLGKFQAAKEKLESALSDTVCTDKLPSLYSMYARTLHHLGQLELAEKYYREYLKLDSSNLKVIYLLTRLLLEEGLFQSAIQLLQNAQILHPRSSQLIVLIAEAEEKLGQPTKAIELLLKYRDEWFPNAQITYNLACTYYRAKFYEKALESALTFQNYEPDSKKAHLLIKDINLALYGSSDTKWEKYKEIGTLLLYENRNQEAVTVLEQGYLMNRMNYSLLRKYCEALFRLKRYDKIVERINYYFLQNGKNADFYLLRAKAFAGLGDYEKAKENVRIFLTHKPDSKKKVFLPIADIYLALYGYTKLGLDIKEFEILTDKTLLSSVYPTLINQGRFLEISLFWGMDIVKLKRSNYKANSLYDIFLKKGDLDQVLQTMNSFHGKKEFSWKRCKEVGNRLLEASRNEEALHILEQGFFLNSSDTQLLQSYCEALYRLTHYEKIVEIITSYFLRYGESVHLYLKLAKAYTKLRNYDKAKEFLHKSIREKPYSQSTLSYAAYFYYRDNDVNMAEYYALRCLAIGSSENERASWVLSQIEAARNATRPDEVEQISQLHMGEHFENNLNKAIHGVFLIQMDSLLEIFRNLDSYQYQRIGESFTYQIHYPSAGYEGGFFGDGHILNRIVVITRINNRNVITAYPVD